MLQLFDINHNKICPLVNYSDYYIERARAQLDKLYFSINTTTPEYPSIQREGYLRTESYGEFVIKEINLTDNGGSVTAQIVADLNVESIKGQRIDSFDTVEQTAEDTVNLALVGTGWIVGECTVTKKRTVHKKQVSAWDVLTEVQSAFNCEMTFDTYSQHVNIYEQIGLDRGVYFAEQLNLKQLNLQGSSRDYVTCLIPIGANGLTIASVNPTGQDYIVNHQYSDKNIYAYWPDNRYTNLQSLYEDAVERLNYLSKPVVSYSASVTDLSRISPETYSTLDFDYGDYIWLISVSKGVREQQRIVKINIYPEEPERNTCELANRIASLDMLNVRFLDTAETVDNVTNQDGTVDGSKVACLPDENLGIVGMQSLTSVLATIGSLTATKIDATDLTAINADINSLKAEKADVTDLVAVTGRITTLEANSATIAQLNATNANISALSSVYATVDDLEAATADISKLQSDKADISDLTAVTADISSLESDEATIVSLLSNNAGIDNLKVTTVAANFAALNKGILGDAQIEKVSANKLSAGTIDTANVTVAGSNGRLKISGNRMQVFDGTETLFERVSVGDVNGDGSKYGIRIRAADGETDLIDENGITNEGMTDGWNTAAAGSLSAQPLDIESVVTAINGADATIKSSRVKMDNETLDVEFSNIQQSVSDQNTALLSQQSQITQNANAISATVLQDAYDEATGNLQSQITSLSATVTGINASITSMQGGNNLLLNSSGLNDLAFWTAVGSISIGSDAAGKIQACKYFNLSSSTLTQNVTVVPGMSYSISIKAKKASTARGYVTITDGTSIYTVMDDSTSAFDWTSYSLLAFMPANASIKITLGSSGANFFVADIMLTQSPVSHVWTPAINEVYIASVRIDQNGINVMNSGSTFQTNITNNSFSISHQGNTVVNVNSDTTVLQSAQVLGNLQVGKLQFMVGSGRVDLAFLS